MIRKIILIIVVLIASILFYFYVSKWRFEPSVNPHPKYFMTIKGKVAPSLAGKVPVKFTMQYQTMNDACDDNDLTVVLRGAAGPRDKNFTYMANTKNRPGNFTIKIPLDHYVPDKCAWRASALSFSVGKNDALTDITGFDLNNSPAKSKNAALVFSCKADNCKEIKYIWFDKNNTLSIQDNYKLLLKLEE